MTRWHPSFWFSEPGAVAYRCSLFHYHEWLASFYFGSLPPRRMSNACSVFFANSSFFLSKRVVRLGFIIGLIALIGVLLSGAAAYRVHEQELTVDGIAIARAIDVHASLVQDRLI